MKLILAVIPPTKLDAVKQALNDVEVFRLTIIDVLGFGRQKGQTEIYRGHELTVNLLRKVQLQIAVNDDFVEPTVKAIMNAARTGPEGRIGDGEEFLLNPDTTPDPVETIAVTAKSVHAERSPLAIEEAVPPPPSPEQILEAMLFVGGPPLTLEHLRRTIRGLSEEEIAECLRRIGVRYQRQNRPYSVVTKDGGYQLAMKPSYRHLKDKLLGGPREARLSQHAIDLLSVVAYRQPITRSELESIRGSDCLNTLRQLIRLGLITYGRRTDSGERVMAYTTTKRFLDLFQIRSLDDLPRLGDSQAIH